MVAPIAAVIIPIGPLHIESAEVAKASALAQTIPVEVFTFLDTDRRGPAWGRNRGVEATHAPFIIFLDADDTLEPTYIEETLKVWKAGKYVYTDWLKEGEPIHSNPYCHGGWHVVTTLLPREAFNRAGGFDDDSPGGEDTVLYRKLMSRGICGIHLPLALMSYNKPHAESRSRIFIHSEGYKRVMAEVSAKYGSETMCCGGDGVTVMIPSNQHLDGDVLVQAVWLGNRTEHGRATGRIYPRTGNGKLLWVDPKDLAMMSGLYVAVDQDSQVEDPELKKAIDDALESVVVAKPAAKKGK